MECSSHPVLTETKSILIISINGKDVEKTIGSLNFLTIRNSSSRIKLFTTYNNFQTQTQIKIQISFLRSRRVALCIKNFVSSKTKIWRFSY